MSAAATLPLFISTAIAAGSPNNEDSSRSTKDGGSKSAATPCAKLELSLKNTFIDVIEEEDEYERPQRRASSAPPPELRSREILAEVDPRMLPVLPSPVQNTARKDSISSPTASTASLDGASNAVCEDHEGSDAASEKSSQTFPTQAPQSDAIAHPRLPLRSVLTTGAKAWVPAPATTTATVLPPAVRLAFAEVVAAGLAALKSYAVTKVAENLHGWTLAGHVRPPERYQNDWALASVKDSLLRAAANSQSVYVVGYEAHPFVSAAPPLLGFTGKLAMLQDNAKACWDYLANGQCQRGSACRWAHPAWQVTVTVQLMESY